MLRDNSTTVLIQFKQDIDSDDYWSLSNIDNLISQNFPAVSIDVKPSKDATFCIVFALSIQKFAYSRHRFSNVFRSNFGIIQIKSLEIFLSNISTSNLSTLACHLSINVDVITKSKGFT